MGKNMILSRRLTAIADMVTDGNRLVDVGCDHGYLPVYLLSLKKIPSAIAADVNEGPLKRAAEHIREYGMAGFIETRLSDGLSRIRPYEGDTLVIAGMGGPLMERILSEGTDVRETFRELILQPQSDVPHFRRFLLDQNYMVVEEHMVFEDGKYYPMMKAVRAAESKDAPWSREELMFGRFLLKNRDPVLKEFLLRELKIREEILIRICESKSSRSEERSHEVEEERQLIKTALKQYDSKGTDTLA